MGERHDTDKDNHLKYSSWERDMIQIKDLGTFEAVPEIVIDIVKGNIKALENALIDGWDIHKPIHWIIIVSHSPLEWR